MPGSGWPTDDRRALEQGLVAVEGEAVVVGTEDRDRAARLGEAVGVHEVDLGEEVQRPLEDGCGHAGAAVRQGRGGSAPAALASASMASTILPSMVGTSMAWVTPLVACGDQPVLGREAHARHRHDAPADVGVAEHRGDARRRGTAARHDGGFVLAGGRELERVEHVREELVVLEHRGLRLGRRAAGEQQHRGPLGGVGEGATAAVLGVDPVAARPRSPARSGRRAARADASGRR